MEGNGEFERDRHKHNTHARTMVVFEGRFKSNMMVGVVRYRPIVFEKKDKHIQLIAIKTPHRHRQWDETVKASKRPYHAAA